ncbi:MAG: heme-binding protein [Candidatus Thermoplasmatota archaeon]|nr:heme-binding protein [Candidatus Thermoplasmatota archaeon]
MTQEMPYTLVKKIGQLEIRRYPEVILAKVMNNRSDSGFGLLFQYINGENKTQRKIAMTAPVITSERIPMTVPVVTGKNYMAFVIPASFTKETTPQPINPAVTIEVEPEKDMAVLRFSGRTTQALMERNIQRLKNLLHDLAIEMKGDPVLMRYNSPFTPGFLRRNEIGVEIESSK